MPSAEGGHAEGDELVGIENLTGSAYTDWLQGDENRNVLMAGGGDDWDDPTTTTVTEGGVFGRGGNDMLAGMDGNDWLNGGDDRDDVWGHDGDDMLLGGPGEDAPYSVSEDGGTVAILPDAAAIAAFDTTQVMIAQEDGSTHWRGGLFGGAGNDTLDGGGGNDYLYGGAGDDTFIYDADDTNRDGCTGSDTLDASEATAAVTANLALNDDAVNNDADTTNDTNHAVRAIENFIGGAGNDDIDGSSVANRLVGGAGNDNIMGGGGDDTIEGGDGNDTLTGGGGADTFVFGPGRDDAQDEDRIEDFSSSQGDRIDLRGYGLTADDLLQLLRNANVDGAQDGTAVVSLNLGAEVQLPGNVTLPGLNLDGGGQITVDMAERFDALEADDFII